MCVFRTTYFENYYDNLTSIADDSTFAVKRKKWQPTPVFLPRESQGWERLVSRRVWGRTEPDTTEATWQQQQ